MLISINWLKDFVELDGISNEEIVKRLTLTTAEIEEVYHKGADTSGVVFAKVLKVKEHPNSTKLHVLDVDKGDEVLQIVCGAPNVYEGMVTMLATIGARVCGNKISKAKLAGVESFGMCCSEAELGIGSDDEGIIDVKDKVKIGTNIKDFYPIDDTVFEVDNKSLTNRPDLWGHYGMARELSAIFGKKLKPLGTDDLNKYRSLKPLSVKVENDNCLRYSSIAIDNINVKKSPMYMKIRLNYVGMRDINLLADMTNYLMLETGQPMHAFDYKIVNGIRVVESKKGDSIITLEGENHKVPERSIMIANTAYEPVAIAGIKGGKLSGISDATNSVLLESATFDATSVRKTSTGIGFKTDSSLRYEKSLDPEMTTLAIARFIHLLKRIDTGIKMVSCLTDVYPRKAKEIKIEFSVDFINRRTGLKLTKQQVVDILNKIEFKVTAKGDKLIAKVPSFRATKDVSIKEDLVEEVARMIGYDNIKPETVKFKLAPKELTKTHIVEYKIKRLLAEKYGVNEVHSYIWNYTNFNKEVGINSPSFISLTDSSNCGQSGIRSELLPSLIKIYSENRNSFQDVYIMEIGSVVSGLDKETTFAIEDKKLAILLASQNKSEEELYFKLKSIVENACVSLLKSGVNYVSDGKTNSLFHPVNACRIISGETVIGEMGVLSPEIDIDKRFNVAGLEIDFNKLVAIPEITKRAKEVSKYQAVNLDFNFLVNEETKYSKIKEIIDGFKYKLNTEYSLKDTYKNDKTLKGKKSMTFAFTISSNERTLTSDDIENFSKKLVGHMEKNGITLRN